MQTSLLLFAWRAINRLAPLFYGEKSGASLMGYVWVRPYFLRV